MHIVSACMQTSCVSCSFAEIYESKADATVNFIGVYLSCLGSKCWDGLRMHILSTVLWFSPKNCNSAMTQQYVEDASLVFQAYVASCCIVCALLFGTASSLVLIFQNVVSQCVVQQLYLYMGLLVINATINSAPLKVLARIARVGAMCQTLGWFP